LQGRCQRFESAYLQPEARKNYRLSRVFERSIYLRVKKGLASLYEKSKNEVK